MTNFPDGSKDNNDSFLFLQRKLYYYTSSKYTDVSNRLLYTCKERIQTRNDSSVNAFDKINRPGQPNQEF